MAINLQPVPRYCVDCAHFRTLPDCADPRYGRCYAPQAPIVGNLNEGEEYISAEVADKARPFASAMRRNADKCGHHGEWFEAKPANV